MFSEIDKTIFPDSCEVIQTSSQQFVYPIFKNGRSSLTESMRYTRYNDWKFVSNIRDINDPIIVFLRDPKKRFISGVNTYLCHLKNTHPELDQKTILWFVENYLFLNRHYCPQFFWLINLSRYTNPDVKLDLQPVSNLSTLTDLVHDAEVEKPSQELLDTIDKFNWHNLELYFYLDQILINQIGKQLTFNQLLELVHQQPELYNLLFDKSQELTGVIRGLP